LVEKYRPVLQVLGRVRSIQEVHNFSKVAILMLVPIIVNLETNF